MQADLGLEAGNFTDSDLRKLIYHGDELDLLMLCKLARSPRKVIRDAAYRYMAGGGNPAENEARLNVQSGAVIGGADEVGRGALAGPIAAACVVLKSGTRIKGIADSKSLTPARREELYEEISSHALHVSTAFIDNSRIDSLGLQNSNIEALRESINSLVIDCAFVICDHFSISNCGATTYGIPKADTIFQSVAAASIIAKVERDRIMKRLDGLFPKYGLKNNKGYGTREHMDALSKYGPCEIHRLSFHGVGQVERPTLWERQVAGE